MKYAVYMVGNNDDVIKSFESKWTFSSTDILFVDTEKGKRIFTVSNITHDVFEDGTHIVRLYCQEKRNHNQ